jgi:hypothetical protein
MARLFTDEDFPRRVAEELRRFGHDVMTTVDAGWASQGVPDEIVLERATADLRAVLTTNRWDFIRLHGTMPHHAGIVACTYDPDAVSLAVRIHAALAATGSLHGQLIRVIRPGPEHRRRSSTSSE